MRYSEYGWLSDNSDGWDIWDLDEEGNSEELEAHYERILEQQRIAEYLEEDCMDVFFLQECDGNCKQCAIQDDYLEVLHCNEDGDCYEVCEEPNGEQDCRYCPIGLRKGIKQIGIRECQKEKKPRPVYKPSPPTAMDLFKQHLEGIHRI